MSKSSKKNQKVVDRRTKAQLLQELAEIQKALRKQEVELIACGREMQNAQLELKRLKEKKKKAQSNQGNLNGNRKLLSDNRKLKDKLQKLEKSSATQIEAAANKLRKTEQQNQYLEKQVLTFKEQIKKAEENVSMEENQDVITLNDIATSKSTFLIHFYPQQGSFRGRVEKFLTTRDEKREGKAFSGLDSEAAFKFISEHLPKIDEQETESETVAPAEVLKELKLLQMRRFQDLEDTLQAHRPFALFTHLQFPVAPSVNNMDVDTSTYEVSVLMTDAKKTKVVARNGAANALSPEIANYENRINMPGVAPGRYWLKISTLAPFANIEENKEIQLNFQP